MLKMHGQFMMIEIINNTAINPSITLDVIFTQVHTG
jgi:hypothetical protein